MHSKIRSGVKPVFEVEVQVETINDRIVNAVRVPNVLGLASRQTGYRLTLIDRPGLFMRLRRFRSLK